VEGTAQDWLRREEFCYSNCIVIGAGEPLAYALVENKLVVGDDIDAAAASLTYVFQNFSIEIDGATFRGGEAAAHSACGWFCQEVNGRLVWALMSLESGPFIGLEVGGDWLCFISASGSRWRVHAGDIRSLSVEPSSCASSARSELSCR